MTRLRAPGIERSSDPFLKRGGPIGRDRCFAGLSPLTMLSKGFVNQVEKGLPQFGLMGRLEFGNLPEMSLQMSQIFLLSRDPIAIVDTCHVGTENPGGFDESLLSLSSSRLRRSTSPVSFSTSPMSCSMVSFCRHTISTRADFGIDSRSSRLLGMVGLSISILLPYPSPLPCQPSHLNAYRVC